MMKHYSIFKFFLFLLFLVKVFFLPLTWAETYDVKPLNELVFYPEYSLNAEVDALEKSQLSPQISGNYQEVFAEETDEVKKNQLLATLDCKLNRLSLRVAEAKIKQTESQIDLYKKILKRQEDLLKSNNLSQKTVDETKANKQIAEAALNGQLIDIEALKYKISLCEIRAPFAGVIVDRIAQPGQSASPGFSAFSLLNLEKIAVSVEVPQHSIESFMQGEDHRFISEGVIYDITNKTPMPFIGNNHAQEIRFTPTNQLLIGSKGTIKWRSQSPYLPAKYIKQYKEYFGFYALNKEGFVDFIKLPSAQEGRSAKIKDLSIENPQVIVYHLNALVVGEKIVD